VTLPNDDMVITNGRASHLFSDVVFATKEHKTSTWKARNVGDGSVYHFENMHCRWFHMLSTESVHLSFPMHALTLFHFDDDLRLLFCRILCQPVTALFLGPVGTPFPPFSRAMFQTHDWSHNGFTILEWINLQTLNSSII